MMSIVPYLHWCRKMAHLMFLLAMAVGLRLRYLEHRNGSGADATVLIDSGTVVTYDGSSNTEIFTIRVNGTLQFATGINTPLVVNTLVVDPAGIFTIGTAASPVNGSHGTDHLS